MMDTLYHLALSLVGGYVFSKAARADVPLYVIAGLSVLSVFMDVEHLVDLGGLHLHSILFAAAPLLLYLAVRGPLPAMFSLMLFGHLVMDMVHGMYGIPLFYPFSGETYMMPESWETYLFGDETKPLATREGIGLAVYFGLTFVSGLLFSRGTGRKTDTRR